MKKCFLHAKYFFLINLFLLCLNDQVKPARKNEISVVLPQSEVKKFSSNINRLSNQLVNNIQDVRPINQSPITLFTDIKLFPQRRTNEQNREVLPFGITRMQVLNSIEKFAETVITKVASPTGKLFFLRGVLDSYLDQRSGNVMIVKDCEEQNSDMVTMDLAMVEERGVKVDEIEPDMNMTMARRCERRRTMRRPRLPMWRSRRQQTRRTPHRRGSRAREWWHRSIRRTRRAFSRFGGRIRRVTKQAFGGLQRFSKNMIRFMKKQRWLGPAQKPVLGIFKASKKIFKKIKKKLGKK